MASPNRRSGSFAISPRGRGAPKTRSGRRTGPGRSAHLDADVAPVVEGGSRPRHAGDTRRTGRGALGHGSRAHSDDEYIVTEGNGKVAGIVESEQSIVDLIYAYANWAEKRPATTR
jgi:hypothetical protein